jgi:serine/threonine protein kinase
MITAASSLNGMTLTGGWEVVGHMDIPHDRTGGVFSVGYLVRKDDGHMAFCKAMDYSSAFADDVEDTELELRRLTDAYIFEREVAERCRDRKLNRVVRVLDYGRVRVPGRDYGVVSYLIFELAQGDARDALDVVESDDYQTPLQLTHDCAVALAQLHGINVSHQDVKPSNLMGWHNELGWRGKLGDLGRAHCPTLVSPHDDALCPGDTAWAPPELLYLWPSVGGANDRRAADAYGLGALMCFMLINIPYSGLLALQLPKELSYSGWQGGGYQEVLPYLVDAHGAAMERLSTVVTEAIRDDAVAIVRELCHPDVGLRGDPRARVRGQHRLDLRRYATRLDLLKRRAAIASVTA